MTTLFKRSPGLAIAACFLSMNLSTSAAAATTLADFEGDYELVSSTTEPASNWLFTKGRISVKKMDERHLSIIHACEWKKSPKEVCSDRYKAQWRNGKLYLQDMNTFHQRMGFDLATHRFMVVTQGVNGTVRQDVYQATAAPLTDKALVRRMKREREAVDDLIDEPAFGHYSKWEYRDNPITVQGQR